MTVTEYISQTFLDFGVRLSEASVLGIVKRNKLGSYDGIGDANFPQVEVAVVKSIPMLLLTPQNVSEGSLSISRTQRDSITEYYRTRCKELGLKDELTRKPKITFL